jgi:hypothetical protein
VKWAELRRTLQKKLGAQHEKGTKHDFWHVYCGETYVGKVKDVHGDGEVRNHERGHVARGLNISEHDLRDMVACTFSRDDFCGKQ